MRRIDGLESDPVTRRTRLRYHTFSLLISMRGLLFLLVALAGCSLSDPPLGTPLFAAPPDGVEDALAAGDAEAAVALLDAAAEAGDLAAMALLAEAHGRGYLRRSLGNGASTHVAIQTRPWSPLLAYRRYQSAVHERAERGDPDARFLLADGYLTQQHIDGAWRHPAGHLDSARAIYRRLEAAGADRLRLALLAQRLGDEPAFRAHLGAAAEAGDPKACIFLSWEERPRTSRFDVGALAAFIDRTEDCRALAPERDRDAPLYTYGASTVQTLRSEAEAGNAAAVATLDSLRATGVFERHPALAPDA